jgi:hypothetical protein
MPEAAVPAKPGRLASATVANAMATAVESRRRTWNRMEHSINGHGGRRTICPGAVQSTFHQ